MWVKDLLRTGTFYPQGQDPITFTRSDLETMRRNGTRMLKHHWTVPVCVEHNDDALPTRRLSRAETLARGFLCFTKGFRITPDGILQAYGDDPIATEDQKLINKLQYVSPAIRWDYRTGDGRTWHGPTITHLAVTPTPVNNKQRPFQRLMSRQVRLSMADYRRVNMAAEPVEVDEEVAEVPVDDDIPDDISDMPESSPVSATSDDELMECFEADGLHIPPDALKTLEKLKQALCIALRTKQKHTAEVPESDEPGVDELPPEQATGEVPPQAMPAPTPPPPGGGLGLSLSKKDEKLIESGRDALKRRLDRCYRTGRITAAIYHAESSKLRRVQLSLKDDGDLSPIPLNERLAAWEALPGNKSNAPSGKKNRNGVALSRLEAAEPVERPREAGTIDTPEEASRVNADMDATLRIPTWN